MTSVFADKVVLVISTERWGKMMLSKHHYATELSERCRRVYFLVPPDDGVIGGVEISALNDKKNLFLVRHSTWFPFSWRFLLRKAGLEKVCMWLQAKRILNQVGSVDIVWSFDVVPLYENLNWFKGSVNIFHPVDQMSTHAKRLMSRSAHIVFSVSDYLLKGFPEQVPRYFVNHGLSRAFEDLAKNRLTEKKKERYGKIRAGYVGNMLSGKCFDKVIFRQVIEKNPHVEFHFWGPARPSDSNVGAVSDEDTNSFISFLKNKNNVILHGVEKPDKLARAMQIIDVFILLLDNRYDANNGSNSHKLLEYLSTGSIVVSSLVSTYAEKNDMIVFANENAGDYVDKFSYVVANINHFNCSELRQKRIQFALEHTYSKQLDRIEALLAKHGLV